MYTISQVSHKLGIPVVTIRAWESRYGAVTPERKPSGHRLFSEEDVNDLRWLMEQTDRSGLTISQAAAQLKQKRARSEVGSHDKRSVDSGEDARSDLRERLLTSLRNYGSEQGKQLLDFGFAMFGYDAMIGDVVIPLMRRVGEEWESGTLSVVQEHFITQLIMQRCFSFAQIFPIDSDLPRTVAFCPPGEHHHFGLMLFSLFLRQRGVDVLYLGPDTPADGLDVLIRDTNIAYAALSLTNPIRQAETLEMLDRLRRSFPELSFVLGGQGFREVPKPYDDWLLPQGTQAEWESWFDHTMKQRRQAVFQGRQPAQRRERT